MGKGLRSDLNKLAGGYAARVVDRCSGRVLLRCAGGARGKFWAIGLGVGAGARGSVWNGGFPPFSEGAKGDVARRVVARMCHRIDAPRFYRSALLIANLTTGRAGAPRLARSTAQRRAEPGGCDPLTGAARVNHLRRVHAIGAQATFRLCRPATPEKNRNVTASAGVGGGRSDAAAVLSAWKREGNGTEAGRGAKPVFVTGGKIEAPKLRAGGGDVN
jgi:hypothetical protein